ncbi:MAG TPA: GNAT family protein [Pyrinomonadaceae bacterium]|jgi:RimJ/RimL family protein N-acetyltransferase
MKIEPVTLEGEFVRLEPLKFEHLDALCEVGLEESLWKWTANIVKAPEDLRRYVETALGDFEKKIALPFVTIDRTQDKIVGSTRFGNIDANNRKTEIGWTWINPAWQRTYINSEAKLLMLTHAFETWKCIRVELKTDAFNEKSRNAMRRIGAREEGTMRNHMITESGRFRDSVYFSIIESEWPEVKKNLSAKLRSYQ